MSNYISVPQVRCTQFSRIDTYKEVVPDSSIPRGIDIVPRNLVPLYFDYSYYYAKRWSEFFEVTITRLDTTLTVILENDPENRDLVVHYRSKSYVETFRDSTVLDNLKTEYRRVVSELMYTPIVIDEIKSSSNEYWNRLFNVILDIHDYYKSY